MFFEPSNRPALKNSKFLTKNSRTVEKNDGAVRKSMTRRPVAIEMSIIPNTSMENKVFNQYFDRKNGGHFIVFEKSRAISEFLIRSKVIFAIKSFEGLEEVFLKYFQIFLN